MTQARKLESQGEIACRDLIISTLIPTERDSGLLVYANALDVAAPITDPNHWVDLARTGRWIDLTFGPPETEGERNPFATIKPFDPQGWTIVDYRYDRNAGWVTISAAADPLDVSESTVRRRADALETEWETQLVRRTKGDHRRIFLSLFVNVWDD